jgi:hypothetical protein
MNRHGTKNLLIEALNVARKTPRRPACARGQLVLLYT